jgi:succinyl-CoA synthetase beta subunit
VPTVLTQTAKKILKDSKKQGWVLEPEAKRLLKDIGMDVPRYFWAAHADDAVQYAGEIGYPVVAKIVSPRVIHKSEQKGVVVGVSSDSQLKKVFKRFSRVKGFAGMLVEEILSGVELIVGFKRDYQFGPVILLGIGGTAVEVFQDVSVRMAPLEERDVESMIKGLKGHQFLEGYRGSEPVNFRELTRMLVMFSEWVMALEVGVESIDLNPVICSSKSCIVADARIMLNKDAGWRI